MLSAPGVPLKSAAGTKRSMAEVSSTRPASGATAPTASQVVPPSAEYSHAPCPAVEASPTITMPDKLSGGVKVMSASWKTLPTMVWTVAPGGFVVSSSTAARVAGPLRVGASLASVMVMMPLSKMVVEPPSVASRFTVRDVSRMSSAVLV